MPRGISRLGTVNDTAFLLSVPSRSSLTPVRVVKASGVVCCVDYKEELCVVDFWIERELVSKVHGVCVTGHQRNVEYIHEKKSPDLP